MFTLTEWFLFLIIVLGAEAIRLKRLQLKKEGKL